MDAHCSADGLPGVFLSGTGHPEKGYEPVPQELCNHALAAIYLVQGQLEKALHHGVALLWVQPLSQRRSIGQRTAEHRHMLALAGKGRPGGEELLGTGSRRRHNRNGEGRTWEWLRGLPGRCRWRPLQTRCRLYSRARRCGNVFLHRRHKAVPQRSHRGWPAMVGTIIQKTSRKSPGNPQTIFMFFLLLTLYLV
ncbi:MAG TPA: hypothetical protein VIH59_03480 [Candidatus Tectomicrobia bacterium]